MKVIALFKKFYVLYEMTVSNSYNSIGYYEDRKYYKRIKKVSMDKDKALALHPDAIFDEELKTRHGSFSYPIYESRKWKADDVFRFGKYFGKKIDENCDYDYMVWYYDQIADHNMSHSYFVKKTLLKAGYEWKTMGGDFGYFVSPEDVKRSKLVHDKNADLIEKLEKNLPINIGPEKNLNMNGEYIFHNVTYKFNHYKVNYYPLSYYECYRYGLPLMNNKTPKRIKFKNLTITDYTYEINGENITIFVENFKMAK